MKSLFLIDYAFMQGSEFSSLFCVCVRELFIFIFNYTYSSTDTRDWHTGVTTWIADFDKQSKLFCTQDFVTYQNRIYPRRKFYTFFLKIIG